MKTYLYNTLVDFYKSADSNQIRISDVLNEYGYKNGLWSKITLSDEALAELGELVGNYLYKTKDRANQVKQGIIDRKGDKEEYLQCFYLQRKRNGTLFIDCSLSGEGFDYCRRKFRQSL